MYSTYPLNVKCYTYQQPTLFTELHRKTKWLFGATLSRQLRFLWQILYECVVG